jgi:hypothetical protein
MATIRNLVFAVVAVPAIALAQSNNIDLFSFVMSDAQLIAGAHVDAAKNSPFGQFVLSQIQAGNSYLQGFMTTTGIDPRSDVTEVLIASNGAPGAKVRWLIGAHGTFSGSIETIEVNALKNGGTITRLPGVDLVTFNSEAGGNPQAANVCIGLFTDGMTDVIGDCTSVQAAIQFGLVSAGPASPVGLKAQQLRTEEDLWFASVIPVSQFANLIPGGDSGGAGNLGGVLKNNLFQAIQQISGGVKFASASGALGAQFSAEVMMDSAQNANSLLNVVNFIVGLLQMNAGSMPVAGSLVSLLGSLQASVDGSTLNIGLSVPEATLEQLFEQIGQMALNHASIPAHQN